MHCHSSSLFSFSGEKSALISAETPPVLKQCVMQISLGKVLGAPGELDSLCSPLNHLWTRPIAAFMWYCKRRAAFFASRALSNSVICCFTFRRRNLDTENIFWFVGVGRDRKWRGGAGRKTRLVSLVFNFEIENEAKETTKPKIT